MKAVIIIAAALVAAVALKVADVLHSRKVINSVGGKANRNSTHIAHFDISNEKEVKNAMDQFKDLAD